MSTFLVTDLGDTGEGSGLQGDLRYVVNSANANTDLSNQIVFQPGLTGTITLQQGKLVVSKALAVFGPGADVLAVSGDNQSGVFDIEASAGQTVILSDLTIADGTGAGQQFGFASGGGLYNNAATLILDRTTFARNTVPTSSLNAGGGGAIFNSQGIVTLTDSTFTENHAAMAPGVAIRNLGTMAIHHSTISANAGGLNGTVANDGTMTLDQCLVTNNGNNIANNGILTIQACTVSGNMSFVGAGLANAGRAIVTDSLFQNNHASNSGGAIVNLLGDLTITGSTLTGNTALYGGGLLVNLGHVEMTNSTLSGNVAERQGGGLYYSNGVLEVTSCTIVFNRSTRTFPLDEWGGGGLYAENAGRDVFRNTILADNSAAQDGQDALGEVLSLGYNLVSQTEFGSGWLTTDLTGDATAPLDPHVGPLQDNGGPTPTHALLLGSPAIGAGDAAVQWTTDQRGSLRMFGHSADIGAFETENATSFRIVAPVQVLAREPFDVIVVALDAWGNTASTYAGTVHFSSSDFFALLPDDTALSDNDAGAHTFNLTLNTPGTQQLQVVDTHEGSIEGSASVAVSNTLDAWVFAAFFRSQPPRQDAAKL